MAIQKKSGEVDDGLSTVGAPLGPQGCLVMVMNNHYLKRDMLRHMVGY
jgi:hypothetical protein